MTPKAHFDAVWDRCDQVSAMHAYLTDNVTAVLRPEELLRAELAIRVSALDLYVHELVTQRMRQIFEGHQRPSPAYLRFRISNESLSRIRNASTAIDASEVFELEVREQLARKTFQYPDDIAEGVRLFSEKELWNEVALHMGATPASKSAMATSVRRELSAVVERRNKIVHEGDLQPGLPRVPWPIAKADLLRVATLIQRVVVAIEGVV